MTTSKIDQLRALAQERRADQNWPGYARVGDFHDGVYDCDHVSPYTKGAANVESDVFLLLQDWVSVDLLSRPLDSDIACLGRKPSLPTNVNLERLLLAHFDLRLDQTYATNLFPFIKKGNMSASIPARDLRRAAERYALPQIRIVAPKLVVCFGLNTYKAMQHACGHAPMQTTMVEAIAAPFRFEDQAYWCQSHPGALGKNNRNRGGVDRVTADWKSMSAGYDQCPLPKSTPSLPL